MLKRVLIANRGEIALRVIRACRELDIETVGVYSTADESALHAQIATRSLCVGPARAADSYLNQDAILSAALATGCDAIHPGYGFLSENPDFADRCVEAGLKYIGPSGDVIRKMGSKAAARTLAQQAGVPVVPGSDGAISFGRMKQVYNADLANSWGNLVSRSLNMSAKYFDGCAPAKPADAAAYPNPLAEAADGLAGRYADKMGSFAYGEAAAQVMELIHAANRYIEDSEPWALAKDPARADELAFVIYNLLEAIRISAHLLAPFMPSTSAEALRRISCADEAGCDDLVAACTWGGLAGGAPVEKGEALFPRLVD